MDMVGVVKSMVVGDHQVELQWIIYHEKCTSFGNVLSVLLPALYGIHVHHMLIYFCDEKIALTKILQNILSI